MMPSDRRFVEGALGNPGRFSRRARGVENFRADGPNGDQRVVDGVVQLVEFQRAAGSTCQRADALST